MLKISFEKDLTFFHFLNDRSVILAFIRINLIFLLFIISIKFGHISDSQRKKTEGIIKTGPKMMETWPFQVPLRASTCTTYPEILSM